MFGTPGSRSRPGGRGMQRIRTNLNVERGTVSIGTGQVSANAAPVSDGSKLYIVGDISSNGEIGGIKVAPTFRGTILTNIAGVFVEPYVAGVTAVTSMYGYRVSAMAVEAGSTVTSFYGFCAAGSVGGGGVVTTYRPFKAEAGISEFGGGVLIGSSLGDLIQLGTSAVRQINYIGDGIGVGLNVTRVTSGSAGTSFTVFAGGATAGSANNAGGNVSFFPGIPTGSGGSFCDFWSYLGSSAGTADGTPYNVLRGQKTSAANDTGLMVYDNNSTNIQRVTVGATNSGGAGFRLLRIPN